MLLVSSQTINWNTANNKSVVRASGSHDYAKMAKTTVKYMNFMKSMFVTLRSELLKAFWENI